MTSLVGMCSPRPLTEESIAGLVTQRTAPGTFALGDAWQDGGMTIRLVGRSDTDILGKLREYIGKYESFRSGYAETPEEAFRNECELFHDLRPVDNLSHHPDRSPGLHADCPRCSL